ncbi:MAG TPA: hypothetical protein VMC05_01285 [Xanthobacteraceae bacterium]|nr:hypothetical protein [Xanthobacteraceae bacterium]
MRFFARLAAGEVALWRVFWLIGTPLALVWDATGLAMITGFGVEEPFVAGFIIAVFTACCAAIPFVAVAIWKSATRYPRGAWWRHALAWGARLAAAVAALAAGLSLITVLYLAYEFVYAILIVG